VCGSAERLSNHHGAVGWASFLSLNPHPLCKPRRDIVPAFRDDLILPGEQPEPLYPNSLQHRGAPSVRALTIPRPISPPNTQGTIRFHNGSRRWAILFPPQRLHSGVHHPNSAICRAAAGIRQRNTKNYRLAVDPGAVTASGRRTSGDQGHKVNYR